MVKCGEAHPYIYDHVQGVCARSLGKARMIICPPY